MEEEKEIMLKVDHVSKVYKLGEIGGTTLRDELQRLKAKILKKEDPTKKIGAKDYNKGEKFKALDDISFEVRKGERIGIIGHNGAGKSTLLKLISRVTGPTEGNIYLNGRVASMLEVGTGFHPELTGRENIYMNGAILGMTKKEIDAKIEDIIEFSEVRQFIDTPVKRYSSGMYVKLAFSVAAHLDSEIMIMDEVLAVGDMAFQNKCISKMKSVSEEEDRTILYVSHNMNTIRQLCDRVIVLNHGHIIFDGNVEDGIGIYMGINSPNILYEYKQESHQSWKDDFFTIKNLAVSNKTLSKYKIGEYIEGKIGVETQKEFENIKIRFEIHDTNGVPVGTSFSNSVSVNKGQHCFDFCLKTGSLMPGRYFVDIVVYCFNDRGNQRGIDGVYPGFIFDITEEKENLSDLNWNTRYWGHVRFQDIEIKLD